MIGSDSNQAFYDLIMNEYAEFSEDEVHRDDLKALYVKAFEWLYDILKVNKGTSRIALLEKKFKILQVLFGYDVETQ